MLTKALDQVTSLTDSRFLLTSFFPLVALLSAFGWLVAAVEPDRVSRARTWWDGWGGFEQAVVVIATTAVLLVGAYVVQLSTTPLTRILEGYYGPVAWIGELFRLGLRPDPTNEHARSPSRVPGIPVDPMAHRKVPLYRSDGFPTKLGNALRAAEVYPRDVYGIDAVLLWPQLLNAMGSDGRSPIEAARTVLDFLVVVTFGALTFTVAGGTYVTITGGGRGVWVGVVVTGAVMAYAGYRGAVAAARDYGDQVRVAFDLHRMKVLKALGLPLPATLGEERRLWGEVNVLVSGSEGTSWWVYDHG